MQISNSEDQTVVLSLTDTEGTGLNVSSTQSVVFGHGVTAEFRIMEPVDGTVPGPITITVEACDKFCNLVTNEDRDVTLVASGSATGAGLVDIQGGLGTIEISNTVAETVILTLVDTEGTGLTVESIRDVVFAAPEGLLRVIEELGAKR